MSRVLIPDGKKSAKAYTSFYLELEAGCFCKTAWSRCSFRIIKILCRQYLVQILPAMLKEVIRRVRSTPPSESPSRVSIHPMAHPMTHISLSSLRWWDGDKTPAHDKSPLLGLKLSSHSFLDSSLEDDLSGATVYTIKTTRRSTTFFRHDNEDNPIEVAVINWPDLVSGNEGVQDPPLVKMRGSNWSRGSTFLKSGPNPKYVDDFTILNHDFKHILNSSSRKFAVPDYSFPIKWRRYDNSYWVGTNIFFSPLSNLLTSKQCTTPCIKGPIAILDLANDQDRITLEVYETLRDKIDPHALPMYKGVSLLLLDYLIVTALLCVTDVSAWMEFANMQNIAPWNDANSGKELNNVPQSLDHSSAMSSELPSMPSNTSLPTTVSSFPPSSGLHGTGMSTSDASCSRWYTDTPLLEEPPTIEDSSKEYLTLLYSPTSNSSSEAVGSSRSHMSAGKQNMPSVLPLLSQLSRPSASTSSLAESELLRPLNQPTTTSLHSPKTSQQPPLRLEKIDSSENVSNPIQSPSRSMSYRRPLPKPPRESAPRRTQSSTPPPIDSPATSTRTFRSLPTPLTEVLESNESRPSIPGHARVHSRSPPMTKASQEELSQWVQGFTDPQRVLPPIPLPETVVFDLPPPSYSSIYITQDPKPDSISTSTTTPPST